jgi:hypothetical protein
LPEHEGHYARYSVHADRSARACPHRLGSS